MMLVSRAMLLGLIPFLLAVTGRRMYDIADSATKGKVLVATRSILPGTRVIDEPPLFAYNLPEKMKEMGRSGICSLLQDMLRKFQSTVKPENQIRYLSLYGPVEEMQPLIHEARRVGNFTDEDARLAVKVFCILRYNAWATGVYCDSSRMAHSCAPNCFICPEGDRVTVHTVRPIEAGEELTISYKAEDVCMHPTFQRRRRFLLSKDFTCHCPRCDAPGDDTRQFECERRGCPGFHLVRYPVDPGVPELVKVKYTGVQYEDPHLLPCNVCKHPASPGFEQRSLEMEGQLPTLADAATKLLLEPVGQADASSLYTKLRAVMGKLKFPRRHVYSAPLLWAEINLRLYETADNQDKQPVVDVLRDLMRLYDGVLGPYNRLSEKHLAEAAEALFNPDDPLSRGTLYAVRGMLQAALRTDLVVKGRDNDGEARRRYNENLLGVMEKIADWDGSDGSSPEKSAAPGEPTCAFCGESPTRAAMSERCCPGCGGAHGGRGTMYCSEACRKAHWPLHRKHCTWKVAQDGRVIFLY